MFSASACFLFFSFFFFNDTATTEIYTLSLHDALPIYQLAVAHSVGGRAHHAPARADVESRHQLSLQRLALVQPLLVAVADLASVVADVVADDPAFFACRSRREVLSGGVLLDRDRSGFRLC